MENANNHNVFRVGAGEQFKSLGAALEVAENGDEIFVLPGIYEEKVLVEKDVLITGEISHNGEKPVIVIPKKYHFDVKGKAVISNIEICEFEKCKYYCDREDAWEGNLNLLLSRTVSFGDNQVVRIFGDCSFENCVFRDTRHAAVTVICFQGNCNFRNCTFKRSQQIGLFVHVDASCSVDDCLFNDNYCGIKVKGTLLAKNSKFDGAAFANIYSDGSSSSEINNCDISQAYVNVIMIGEESFIECSNSRIYNADKNNVHLEYLNKAVFRKCKISGARENGIFFKHESCISAEGCEIFGNEVGVFVDSTGDCNIKGCSLSDNEEYGIAIYEGKNCSLESVMVKDNHKVGVFADSDTEVTLKGCKIFGNQCCGVINNEGEAELSFENCENQDDEGQLSNYKILNETGFWDIDFQEDLEDLFDLFYENLPVEDFCGDWAVDYPYEKLYEEFVRNIYGKAITVKYNKKLIGYCQIVFTDNMEYACLYNLVIHKDFRRIGLGTKLFEYARDYVKYISRKIIVGSDCVKSKAVAYEFFTKMGFVDEPERGDLLTFDLENMDL